LRALGYDGAGDLVGASLATLVHPDDCAAFARAIEAAAEAAPALELRLLAKGGNAIVTEAVLVRLAFERDSEIAVIARDVAEKRALQERLLQADRLASLGTLSAGVAHEINNPLTYVTLNMEHLERELMVLARRCRESAEAHEPSAVAASAEQLA